MSRHIDLPFIAGKRLHFSFTETSGLAASVVGMTWSLLFAPQ